MKITISSDSLNGYGLNRIFAFAKDAGLDGVDIIIEKEKFDTQNADYIKSLIEEYGIPVVAVELSKKMNSEKTVMKYIELADAIGAKTFVMYPPNLLDFKFIQWMKDSLKKVKRQVKCEVSLINPEPRTMFGILPEHAFIGLEGLKRYGGVTLDTANLYSLKHDLLDAYITLRGSISHIFLSNVLRGIDHTPPQDGALPLESLLAKLKRDNYDKAVSIRVRPRYLGVGNDEKVHASIVDIKDYINKYYSGGK